MSFKTEAALTNQGTLRLCPLPSSRTQARSTPTKGRRPLPGSQIKPPRVTFQGTSSHHLLLTRGDDVQPRSHTRINKIERSLPRSAQPPPGRKKNEKKHFQYRNKPRAYVKNAHTHTTRVARHDCRFFFYRETRLDEVSHVHRHLLDLRGVELLDIAQVPHVALERKIRKREERKAV